MFYGVRVGVRVLLLLFLLAICAACAPDADRAELTGETTRGEGAAKPGAETTVEVARPEGEATAVGSGPVEVETGVVARGLRVPWGIVFLPGGDALVSERDTGRLLRVSDSGSAREVQTLPAEGLGEGGLLGIALSPDYEEDGLVYAYYSAATDNRVVRFELGEEPEPILTGIPVASYHNGGRIAFGPDGMLYVGTGDAGQTANSQDTGSLGGKILRVTPDGGVPEDNPLGPESPVYSYGHRNVQGLSWDESGRLYATEFGQDRYDEINLIEAGENYGWPEVEGVGKESEYVDPIATFTPDEASPSGAAILRGGAIPQWEGDLFVATLRGERLWRLDLAEDGTVSGTGQLLRGEAGRLRTVAQAPDGSLWVLTSNRDGRGEPEPGDDRILRLGP